MHGANLGFLVVPGSQHGLDLLAPVHRQCLHRAALPILKQGKARRVGVGDHAARIDTHHRAGAFLGESRERANLGFARLALGHITNVDGEHQLMIEQHRLERDFRRKGFVIGADGDQLVTQRRLVLAAVRQGVIQQVFKLCRRTTVEHQAGQAQPFHLGLGALEQRLGYRVEVDDHALRVDGHDRIHRGLHHRIAQAFDLLHFGLMPGAGFLTRQQHQVDYLAHALFQHHQPVARPRLCTRLNTERASCKILQTLEQAVDARGNADKQHHEHRNDPGCTHRALTALQIEYRLAGGEKGRARHQGGKQHVEV